MSDSYTNLLYHIVFSTKDRRPLITSNTKRDFTITLAAQSVRAAVSA